MASGPTSNSFVSQRLKLHYVDWGNEEAPPLLLVHGGRDHCRNWDWVAEKLRDRWHVIAPDLRGHGDSAWAPDGNYEMGAFVYDLAQLFDEVSFEAAAQMAAIWRAPLARRKPAYEPAHYDDERRSARSFGSSARRMRTSRTPLPSRKNDRAG